MAAGRTRGEDTRGGIVDTALMQSLFEGDEREVKPFVADYGMVIADECHHIAAFTFEKVMKSVRARYVYGLSATPVRKDGHQPIIFMQCGPVRYIVDAKSEAQKRAFSHFVILRFTRTRLPAIGGIQDAYAGIVENDARNDFIISDAQLAISEGRTPILLTERKAHAAYLASRLAEDRRCKSGSQNLEFNIFARTCASQKIRTFPLASKARQGF